MKKILIPTDFSNAARNAFDFAIRLFGADCKFTLINSYEEPGSASASMISLREILHEASEDSLKEELAYVVKSFGIKSANIDSVSEYGDAVSAITMYASKNKFDLIIMGTTGASGLKEIMIGSVASGVIQEAHCPVLAVPIGAEYVEPKSIVLASDLEKLEKKELPQILLELIKEHGSEVTILTINAGGLIDSEEKAERGYSIHVQLQELNHKFEIVDAENVEQAIINYAHAEKMNLVVTFPRKSSWIKRIVNPSISKKLAQHLDIPILALAS